MGNLLEDLKIALSILVNTTAPRGADRDFIIKTLQEAIASMDVEGVIDEMDLEAQIEETEVDSAMEAIAKEPVSIRTEKAKSVIKSETKKPS